MAAKIERDVASIHILRATAAMFVAVHHLGSRHLLHIDLGRLGVDIFFVVSGFIIPYALSARSYRISHYPIFVAKRLLRLEPAYVVSIGICIAIGLAAAAHPLYRGDAPNYSLGQIASHLFYLIPFTEFKWINVVYWTLAYEFIFYLLIGLLFPLVIRSSLFFFGAGLVFLILVNFIFYNEFQPHRVSLFFIGLAVFRRFVGLDGWAYFWSNIVMAVVLILKIPLGLELLNVNTSAFQTCMGGLLAALSVLFLRMKAGPAIMFFSHISYSLYLLHVPIGVRVVHIGERVFGQSIIADVSVFSVALLVSIGAAYLSYRLFEVPGLALSSRLSYPVLSKAAANPATSADKI